MSLQKYVSQLNPKNESYISHVDKIQTLLERVDTTLNASVTELFPCLAFNKKFKPSSVEDFKKFLDHYLVDSLQIYGQTSRNFKDIMESFPFKVSYNEMISGYSY